MRWCWSLILLSSSLLAQSFVEAPVSVCAFLGVARGANEVPATAQDWGIAGGIAATVRERTGRLLAGELNCWYARTLASAQPFRYATGSIIVDARLRLNADLPLELPTTAFVAAGVGVLFPLNEQVLAQPPSPTFEPNTPALAIPITAGVRVLAESRYGIELRATYVLSTTDNLNAPHDGQFDGVFALMLGIVFPIEY